MIFSALGTKLTWKNGVGQGVSMGIHKTQFLQKKIIFDQQQQMTNGKVRKL